DVCSSDLILEAFHFRVLAEIADQDDLVDAACHGICFPLEYRAGLTDDPGTRHRGLIRFPNLVPNVAGRQLRSRALLSAPDSAVGRGTARRRTRRPCAAAAPWSSRTASRSRCAGR